MYLINQIIFNKQILFFFLYFDFFSHLPGKNYWILLQLPRLLVLFSSSPLPSLPFPRCPISRPVFAAGPQPGAISSDIFHSSKKAVPIYKNQIVRNPFCEGLQFAQKCAKNLQVLYTWKNERLTMKAQSCRNKNASTKSPQVFFTSQKLQEALPNTSEDISDRILEDMSNRIQKI